MPIKLGDLTCEKCIYYREKKAVCRRHNPVWNEQEQYSVWPDVYPEDWCGDGEWVMVAKGEHTSLRSVYSRRDFLYHPNLTYEWPEE